MYDIDRLRHDAVNRRAFLTRMTAAGLGAAASAALAGCGGGGSSSGGADAATRAAFPGVSGSTDNQVVLNYALSLEALEAYLYLVALNAAAGRAITTPLDAGTPAAGTTGNYSLAVSNGSVSTQYTAAAFLYLVQFAYVEAAHRDFLLSVLGSAAKPVVPADGKYKFTTTNGLPGTDLGTILTNVLPLEETGVRAYLGAAPYITDNTTLQTAATIYSTECRHSASIETILGLNPGPSNNITGVPAGEQEVATAPAPNVFEKFLTPAKVLAAVPAYFS